MNIRKAAILITLAGTMALGFSIPGQAHNIARAPGVTFVYSNGGIYAGYSSGYPYAGYVYRPYTRYYYVPRGHRFSHRHHRKAFRHHRHERREHRHHRERYYRY
jgi:hypothetical protein